MEFIIELPVIARMKLAAILNEKASGKGKDRDYTIAADLYDKIAMDREDEDQYQIPQADGTSIPNVKVILNAPLEKFSLNFNEMEKLEKYLDEATLIPGDRKLWYAALMKQIEEAKKPAPDDEKTKKDRLASRK